MATGGASSDSDGDSNSGLSSYSDDANFLSTEDMESDWLMAQHLQDLSDALPDEAKPGNSHEQKFDSYPEAKKSAKEKALDEEQSNSVVETKAPAKLIQRTPMIKSTALSKKMTSKILANNYNIKMMAAQAAVQCSGCDIELCLQWVDRNKFNYSLLDEKSKQFQLSCGLVGELEMLKWTVKTLTRYGVAEELAKAATKIKGYQNFKEVKSCAVKSDLHAAQAEEAVVAYNERVDFLQNQVSHESEEKSEELIKPGEGPSFHDNPGEWGIPDQLLKAIRKIPGLIGFETLFEWMLKNQYDGKVDLDTPVKLVGEFQAPLRIRPKLEKPFLKFFETPTPVHHWYLGLQSELWEATALTISSLSDCLKAFRGHGRWTDLQFIRKIQAKNAAVKILSDFMHVDLAKAAVEANSSADFDTVDVDRCRKWADEHRYDEHTFEKCVKFDRLYEGRILDEFIASRIHHALRWTRSYGVLGVSSLTRFRAAESYEGMAAWEAISEKAVASTHSTDLTINWRWIRDNFGTWNDVKMFLKVSDELIDTAIILKSKLCNAVFAEKQFGCDEEQTWQDVLQLAELPSSESKGFITAESYEGRAALKAISEKAVASTHSTDLTVNWRWIRDNFRRWKDVKMFPIVSDELIYTAFLLEANLCNAVFAEKRYGRDEELTWQDVLQLAELPSCESKGFITAESYEGKAALKAISEKSVASTSSTDLTVNWRWIRDNFGTWNDVKMFLRVSGQLRLCQVHEGFLIESSTLKMQKVQTIGSKGGEIALDNCSITFPEGALKQDTDIEMTLDNNPDNFPVICIPITPILGCRPSIEFEKPVSVKMTTCYSAIGDSKVSASLYQRKEVTSDWGEIQEVEIGSRNVVQFDVMHFSDDLVGVSGANGNQGEFHLINDVYIKKDTGTIASIFFIDKGAHVAATEELKNRGVYPLLMVSKEIIAKMNTEMKVSMQCRKPLNKAITNCSNPVVKITPQFLKKRGHELYFEIEPELGTYVGTLSVWCTIKVGDEEEILPLTMKWPLVLDPPASNVTTINAHSITAGVMATGNETTVIEDGRSQSDD